MKAPIVRFAPSPTGRIHIGNARTALFNWLFAKRSGGRFVLRFDDTDQERSREEYAQSIASDLNWLGIHPDLTVRQSQRFALYDAAAQKLREAGLLYPCYETADELDRRRKRQIARGQPPIYDRAALSLTQADHDQFKAQGRKPHWRFKLESKTIEWVDLVRGPSHIDCASLSDPVLIREDGTYLYTLPSVVDDIDLGITHVIRGEDHVTNTAVQIQLFETLSGAGAAPQFGHHNLLASSSGEGLSKRSGALSITGLREAGIESLAVASLAVLTGSSDSVHAIANLEALLETFDLAHVSRNSAKFDPAELDSLSARTLHALEAEAVRARLAELGVTGEDITPFWLAVRSNLTSLADAKLWWTVIHGEITPVIEDADFANAAAELLPPEPWDQQSWSQWTAKVKETTGRKGKALFHPLRLALTGQDQGPELAVLLPLIGKLKASARLHGRVS
jgi:glutamyl-tRNA synthetase